jgi:replication fork clamp-binding protein CrfC
VKSRGFSKYLFISVWRANQPAKFAPVLEFAFIKPVPVVTSEPFLNRRPKSDECAQSGLFVNDQTIQFKELKFFPDAG